MKNKRKQLKTTGKKQAEALKSLEFSNKESPSINDFILSRKLNREIINKLKNIGEQEQNTDRKKLLYKGYKTTCDFRKFNTIQVLGDAIRNDIITMIMEIDEENQLAKKTREFISKTKTSNPNMKREKEHIKENAMASLQEEIWSIIFLKVEYFHDFHMIIKENKRICRAGIYLLKVNNKNNITRCEIYSL